MISRVRGVAAAVFPGSRIVWYVAGGLGAVLAAVLLHALVVPRDSYTGTNSFRVRDVAQIPANRTLCVRDLELPAGTGRVELDVNTGGPPRPPMRASLHVPGRAIHSRLGAGPGGRQKVDFVIPKRPGRPAFVPATLCLRAAGRLYAGGIPARGVPGLHASDIHTTLDGRRLSFAVGVWFRPPAGERRSVLSQLPTIFRRAALFRPGLVGPWTYWLLLLGVLPAQLYSAIRLLATSASERRRRLGLGAGVAALAFLNAGAWALITPAFQAPDESEHYAYVEYLAETGHAPGGAGRDYSSAELAAANAVGVWATSEDPDGRPPWFAADERRYENEVDAHPPRHDDGGGGATATGPHSPLYYGAVGLGYRATEGASVFSQLTAVRLLSALAAAIVALCAFGIVREIVPRHPVAAVGAGLVVAFEPMFGFISGAVNNDNGVNAMAGVVLYLVVRGLRRGLTVRLAIALGVSLVVLPLMKATGYILYAPALVGLLGMAWRDRRRLRHAWPAGLALAGSLAAAATAWALISPVFHRTLLVTPGGVSEAASRAPKGYLSYLWQIFLPKLPFMTDLWVQPWPFWDIYVVRGWANFGWYALSFPDWVYGVILGVMVIVGVAGVTALGRWRAFVRTRGWELAVLIVAVLAVVGGVEIPYYTDERRLVPAEFGRYAFTAITALSAGAIGACFAVGRRWVPPAVTALVVLVLGLSYASQWLTVTGFYT